MKAIVVTDEAAGTAGMTLVERPDPPAAINDVIVEVHASGFVPTEMAWPSTWTDRRDLDSDALDDVGGVDVVFDVIGGEIQKRSARLIRTGGTLVSVVGPPEARPADGLSVDFVVESDRAQLSEIVQRVRDGRLRTNIGTVATLDDAVAALNPTARRNGKTIIRIRP